MTTHVNAASLRKDIHVAQDRELRLQAIQDPKTFMSLAQQQGYSLSPNNFVEDLSKLSETEIAAIWNPGIGDRRHLVRR